MANHKSALKRIKQTAVRTEQNRAHRSRLRNQIRQLRSAIDAKDKTAAQSLAAPVFALIDHSIHKGILHRNTAARYKSRLSLRLKTLA
ncbi:MAG TPA: 30S ribosomal protein S20 [Terriglobia bacterium]|nr:30S ribosomal protein S20 [Terriglobia bacterium]